MTTITARRLPSAWTWMFVVFPIVLPIAIYAVVQVVMTLADFAVLRRNPDMFAAPVRELSEQTWIVMSVLNRHCEFIQLAAVVLFLWTTWQFLGHIAARRPAAFLAAIGIWLTLVYVGLEVLQSSRHLLGALYVGVKAGTFNGRPALYDSLLWSLGEQARQTFRLEAITAGLFAGTLLGLCTFIGYRERRHQPAHQAGTLEPSNP